MRSRSSLILTLLLSLAGIALQLWCRATAFEPGSGLPVSGAPALIALTVFAVAVLVIALLLSLPLRGSRPPADRGLYTGLSLPASLLGALAGVLAGAGGVVQLTEDAALFLRLRQPLELAACAVDVVMLLAGIAMIWMCFASRREGRQVRHSLASLLPGFAGCFWLVIFYHGHSRDPIVAHYCWMLLALMASILALYYQAAFAFDRPRPLRAMACTALAAVYAFTALPGSDTLADALLLAGLGVWMLLHTSLIPRVSQIRGHRERVETPTAEQ